MRKTPNIYYMCKGLVDKLDDVHSRMYVAYSENEAMDAAVELMHTAEDLRAFLAEILEIE